MLDGFYEKGSGRGRFKSNLESIIYRNYNLVGCILRGREGVFGDLRFGFVVWGFRYIR